jgi:signal transduction histidine kinase
MIEQASSQLTELLDELGLVARIEADRYEPVLRDVDTADLARSAAERLGEDRVTVEGAGGIVQVDADAAPRAVSALAKAALRHGALEQVVVRAEGTTITITPVLPNAAPVVLGEDLRDLGAAAAVRFVRAVGGEVSIAGETLTVRLPVE